MKKLLLICGMLASTALGRLGNIDQQYSSEVNLLRNPGFEQGIASWVKTGASTLVTTTSANFVYIGTSAGMWDPSATGEFLQTQLTAGTVSKGLAGRDCVGSFWYLWDAGAGGDITAVVTDGTTDVSAKLTLAPTADGEYRQAFMHFGCPALSTNIQIELESTADAASITIDQAFLGNSPAILTNVLPLAYENTDTITNLGATGTLTHDKNIPVQDQNWVATVSVSGGDDLQLESGWITDKTSSSVDYDFTGLAGADTVTVKLMDTSSNSAIINNLAVNFTYGPSSSAPATSIAHGLGLVPRSLVVQHEGQTAASEWDDITAANHCNVDATNVNCDFSPITIDATHKIFVGVSTSVNPAFFDGQVDDLNITTLLVGGETIHHIIGGSQSSLQVDNGSNTQGIQVVRIDNGGSGSGFRIAKARGDGPTPAIILDNDTIGTIRFWGHDGTQFIETANIEVFIDGAPGTNDMPGRMVFGTTPDGGTVPVEAMEIQQDGDVIIKTGQLQADSGSVALPGLAFTGTPSTGLSEGSASIFFSTGGVERLELKNGNEMKWQGNNDYFLTFGDSVRLLLDLDDDAGDADFQIMNAATQTVRFQVSEGGTTRIYNTASVGSTALCSQAGASAIGNIGTCTSTIRMKKDVEDISDADAEKFYKVRPVKFNWKSHGKPDYGVIAEEMEETFPELVAYDEVNGQVTGFNYRHYTAILTKVTQDQKKKIDVLEAYICSQDEDAPFCEGVN